MARKDLTGTNVPFVREEEEVSLIKALEKQTVAITGFTAAVVGLSEALCDLLEEEEDEDEGDEPSTYLNGDPIQR